MLICLEKERGEDWEKEEGVWYEFVWVFPGGREAYIVRGSEWHDLSV